MNRQTDTKQYTGGQVKPYMLTYYYNQPLIFITYFDNTASPVSQKVTN